MPVDNSLDVNQAIKSGGITLDTPPPTTPPVVATTAPKVKTPSVSTPTAVVSSGPAEADLQNISNEIQTAQGQITALATKKAADKAASDAATAATAAKTPPTTVTPPTPEEQVANTPAPGNMYVYDRSTGARTEIPVNQPLSSSQTMTDVTNASAQNSVSTGSLTIKQFGDGTYGTFDNTTGKYVGGATAVDFNNAKGANKAQQDLLAIQNGTYPLTAGQQAQIDDVKNYYDDLIEHQKVINANVTGNTTGLQNLYGVGGSVIGMSAINKSIADGQAKIAELDRKMTDAVNGLTSALQNENLNVVKTLYETYKQGVDDKQKAIDTLHTEITNAAKTQAAEIASVNDSYARKYIDTTTPILPSDTPAEVQAKLQTSPTYLQDQKTKAGTVDQDVLDGMLTVYKKTGLVPAGMGNASVALKKAFYAAIGNTPALADEATKNKAALTAATSALTNQQTQLSATQTSAETMKKSLDLVSEYENKVDKSGVPLIDKYILWTQGKAQGNADTAALNAAITTAATEYAKIMSGASASIAGVTVSSADDVKRVLDSSMSKGQIAAVISVMKQDANFRLTSQQGTVNQIQSDISDLGNTTTGGNSSGGSSSGSTYISPSGKTYTLPNGI